MVTGVRVIETEVKWRVPAWGRRGVSVYECRFGLGDEKVIELVVRAAYPC